MKLSYSWLKDYLKCDLTPDQVAEAMTSIGIEVDTIYSVPRLANTSRTASSSTAISTLPLRNIV